MYYILVVVVLSRTQQLIVDSYDIRVVYMEGDMTSYHATVDALDYVVRMGTGDVVCQGANVSHSFVEHIGASISTSTGEIEVVPMKTVFMSGDMTEQADLEATSVNELSPVGDVLCEGVNVTAPASQLYGVTMVISSGDVEASSIRLTGGVADVGGLVSLLNPEGDVIVDENGDVILFDGYGCEAEVTADFDTGALGDYMINAETLNGIIE